MADFRIRDRCNLFFRQQTLTVKNQFILDSVPYYHLGRKLIGSLGLRGEGIA